VANPGERLGNAICVEDRITSLLTAVCSVINNSVTGDLLSQLLLYMCRGSSVSTHTGPRDSRLGSISDRGNTRILCLRHRAQTGPGAHPASHPMVIRGSFREGKVARAWSWPFTSMYCRS